MGVFGRGVTPKEYRIIGVKGIACQSVGGVCMGPPSPMNLILELARHSTSSERNFSDYGLTCESECAHGYG